MLAMGGVRSLGRFLSLPYRAGAHRRNRNLRMRNVEDDPNHFRSIASVSSNLSTAYYSPAESRVIECIRHYGGFSSGRKRVCGVETDSKLRTFFCLVFRHSRLSVSRSLVEIDRFRRRQNIVKTLPSAR